jgi:hypothetical protein
MYLSMVSQTTQNFYKLLSTVLAGVLIFITLERKLEFTRIGSVAYQINKSQNGREEFKDPEQLQKEEEGGTQYSSTYSKNDSGRTKMAPDHCRKIWTEVISSRLF